MTFFCYTDNPADFRACAQEVKANDMKQAAETYGSLLFATDDIAQARPIPIIVAETRNGRTAVRFNVKRIVEIRHEASDLGGIEIPDEQED